MDVLTKSCMVMSSGDALLAAEVIARTRALIPTGQNNTSILSVAEKLRDTFMTIHLERVEAVLLKPRGFSLTEFKEKGAQQLTPQAYQEVSNQIFNFGINVVEFLVAGIDNAGGHIFRVHYSGIAGGSWLEWCDKFGHREIGSGALHASILLSLEGQFSGLEVNETIYNVYSAKKSAELAPGVGPSTDLAIITSEGIVFADKRLYDALDSARLQTKKNRPDLSGVDVALKKEPAADANKPTDSGAVKTTADAAARS